MTLRVIRDGFEVICDWTRHFTSFMTTVQTGNKGIGLAGLHWLLWTDEAQMAIEKISLLVLVVFSCPAK